MPRRLTPRKGPLARRKERVKSASSGRAKGRHRRTIGRPGGDRAVAISIAGITDHPLEFYGKTVTVSGTLREILETGAFTLFGDGLAGG